MSGGNYRIWVRAAYLQRLICLLIEAYTFEEIQVTKALVEYRGIPCGITWEHW